MEWIELWVGGERFETLKSTLEQLAYFRARANWSGQIRIDRDPVAFRALLNHLRDPRYAFPQEYWPELDFFDPVTPERQPVGREADIDLSEQDLKHLSPNLDTGVILPLVVNGGSELLGYALPQIDSPFIKPVPQSTHWPCRTARRLPVQPVITVDFHPVNEADYWNGFELHFRGASIDCVKSVTLYRGQHQLNRLEQTELAALHQLFDKRRFAMRLFDLFGVENYSIQSRKAPPFPVHIVDPHHIYWKIEVDTEILEAIWLVKHGCVSGVIGSHPEPDFVGDYQFAMHPVMAKQQISAFSVVKLCFGKGLLQGLLVILQDSLAERIEVVAMSLVICTLLGSENTNGIYHFQFPDLDLGRLQALELHIWPLKPCQVTVIGQQRHFNMVRFGNTLSKIE